MHRHPCRQRPSQRRLHVAAALALLAAAASLPRPAHADAAGAELLLLTSHVQSQRDAPVRHYRRKLDAKGQHVLTPGIEAYYENALEEPLWKARAVRFTLGVASDSVTHTLVYVAVLGRWLLWEGERTAWSLQLGPGFLARESWRSLPEYTPDNPLRESDTFLPGWEWTLLPLGELDFHYRFTPTLQGVWSIFPGFPYVIMQAVGLRWEF